MRYVAISLLLFALVTSDVVCDNTKVYAKFTKKTISYASEEAFQVLDGATVLYSSPSFVNNQERVLETCLSASQNNQYTLKMTDIDRWSSGAWIQIEGINGNRVFKQMMTMNLEQTYMFSLYSPVNKGDTWKYTATATGTWTQTGFDETSWADIVTGETTQTATGTQYFRHTFAGIAGQAAIDMQVNYRYGVIAYINGVEVFRDNMPEGPATAATHATGSYSIAGYHGVIRPSGVAENAASVLAVEVHPTTEKFSVEEVIEFNGFLSFLSGMDSENKCFVYPYDAVVTYTSFTSAANAFAWTSATRAYTSTIGATITADYSSYTTTPMINGARIWPATSASSTVTDFTLEGSDTVSGTYNSIYVTEKNTYVSNQWKQYTRVTTADPYKFIRFTALAAQSSTMGIYELQFLICNNPAPTTIPFTVEKSVYYRNYEMVKLIPDVYGFQNCQANPALPAGVTIDPQSCTISGIATEAKPQTTYSITGIAGTVTATGTVTLTFDDCTTAMYKIVRTYKSSPQNEFFRIYDTATSTIIYEVQQGHSHTASEDWEHYICVAPERFDVVVDHTGTYWASNSYFYMYYMLPDMEQELVVKTRFDSYQSTITNMYARRPHINHSQQWYYKFDSVPANWHSSDMSGWSQANRGSFPTASNKVQLYKQTFTVNNLNEVKGYILSIRYKYGCIVYLNGQEAWRNGVTGEVGASPVAENAYNDLKYHVVTLPGKTIATTAQPTAKTFLQQGVNTIAIALVAIADTQTSADFDCVVRLMTSEHSESHIWEMTGTVENMTGSATNAFSMYYSNTIYYSTDAACTSNNLQITLDNDRREWVSSMHIQTYYLSSTAYNDPTQFKVYGRNTDTEEWTLLKEVTGLTWSMPGQKRRIYFQNNASYNKFKFENIFPANHASQCKWRISSLDLYADNVLAELPPLTYPENVEVFKDIEMAEVIPTNADGYFGFTIAPALPTGLALDPFTGWISGTATVATTTPTTYTITANKVTGGTATATFTFAVAFCTGGRSLVTVRIRADSYKAENSWKLFQGRGTTGTLLDSVDAFPVTSAYYYLDFCLSDGIYTFQGQDTYGDGWAINTGYTLTADVGAFEFEIMEMQNGEKPVTVSTVFSTYFPFQAEYTDWKVSQTGYVAGWNTIAFDDSTWSTMKAADIPTAQQTTTYIRKTFTLTNIADYQVLNIRMKYAGGVACYFNGNLVALINLEENFTATSESIEVHDSTVDAKFHIILPTSGMVEGVNVIAFEVHRPAGTSSSEPVVFDATGIFGVEDCSTVVDTYSALESTATTTGTIEAIFDLDPYTTGTLPNTIGTFIEWTVDNRMGSKWNVFNILGSTNRISWGFDVFAYFNPADSESIEIFRGIDLTVNNRERTNLPVPAAIAGFRKFRWEVTDPSTSTGSLNSFFMGYCKASGAVCPAIDSYPSVGEGQISPSTCPIGYVGYSYRECSGGQLGDIKMDKCVRLPPLDASYSKTRYEFVMGVEATTGVPSIKNVPSRWYIDAGITLPLGLSLNELTGEISGTPVDVMDMTTLTVYAENEAGAVSATIALRVRKGRCMAEGVFSTVDVDEIAVYECALQGAYVGTMQRPCTLGAVDGEWGTASGFCMSIATIVILVVVAVLIIAVVILIFIRSMKRTKAVGGVKSKKSTKKVVSKKTNNPKSVKV